MLFRKTPGGMVVKPIITTHSYEALAILRFYSFSNFDYPGLKDLLFKKINKSGNNHKISEPLKKEGFNYQETSNMLIRLERLESKVEGFGNKSDAIDGISAARFLGVSKRTIDYLAAKKIVDSYHIGSRRLFRLSDLEKYRQSLVENNRQQG
jgi:excisionase family DNA binding protein